MGTSSISAFSGSSTFAAQLQQVITTALARASAPMQLLAQQQSILSGQQTELQMLSADFASLQVAINQLNSAAQSNALSAQVSNTQVASASAQTSALPGTYSVSVSNLGSRANTMSSDSLTKVSDASTTSISTSNSYTLTIGTSTYTITPASDSLSDLVTAINSSAAKVQATIVNVGGSGTPDYRLSVQGLDYSPSTVQLNDGTTDLLQSVTPGSYVQYQVNGEPATPINSTNRNVSVSAGVNVTFLGTGTADVTVSRSTSGIADAVSSFVRAYNNTATELNRNRGKNGGALSGESVVYDLQGQLQNLASFSGGSGSVTSLSALGLSFDSNGLLQLDQTTLASVDPSQALALLGTSTSGGFLQSASNMLTSIADPIAGSLAKATQSVATEISDLGDQITNQQQQVTNLQTKLNAQMASADAAISSLEAKVTEITDLFNAMQQAQKNFTG